MNAERRRQLAEAITALLPAAHKEVTESWPDLMPVSTTWRQASLRRARTSARAALEGIVPLIVQGDLDDRTWDEVITLVHGQGFAAPEEVAELLRSVRVVGVEFLADRLEETAGLTHTERWDLQREVSAYCDNLLGEEEQPEREAFVETLAELAQGGPDIQ